MAAELGAGFAHENRCGELALADSLGVLAGARRFIGIDSALVHAARGLGVPSTSFFGPTDPATLLEPIAGYDEVVHYRPPICSPCLHVAQTPPCKGRNVCMQLFTADAVARVPWVEDATRRERAPARVGAEVARAARPLLAALALAAGAAAAWLVVWLVPAERRRTSSARARSAS